MRRTAALWAIPLLLVACSSSGGSPAPTSAPSAAADMQVMGTGTLQPIDGTARGSAQLVVLPDQTYEVVLEDFSAELIAHTNVVLVSNAAVTSSSDIDKSKLLDLGPLKSTQGMQSFVIPAAMAGSVMEGYHSVVIWDTEMTHAVAAAALQ